MQRNVTASLDFIRLSPDRKVPVGAGMINGLTNNAATFPNLPVTLTNLTEANQALGDAAANARTGDKTANAALLNAEKTWDSFFRSTAKYVGTVANGNEETIRMGGCTPTKAESSPAQIPGACKNVQVIVENAQGTASIGCDADSTVKAYLYIAATNGANIIQDGNMLVITVGDVKVYLQADIHRRIMLHNLESGVPLNVSMMGLNNAGCGPLTNGKTIIPQ